MRIPNNPKNLDYLCANNYKLFKLYCQNWGDIIFNLS